MLYKQLPGRDFPSLVTREQAVEYSPIASGYITALAADAYQQGDEVLLTDGPNAGRVAKLKPGGQANVADDWVVDVTRDRIYATDADRLVRAGWAPLSGESIYVQATNKTYFVPDTDPTNAANDVEKSSATDSRGFVRPTAGSTLTQPGKYHFKTGTYTVDTSSLQDGDEYEVYHDGDVSPLPGQLYDRITIIAPIRLNSGLDLPAFTLAPGSHFLAVWDASISRFRAALTYLETITLDNTNNGQELRPGILYRINATETGLVYKAAASYFSIIRLEMLDNVNKNTVTIEQFDTGETENRFVFEDGTVNKTFQIPPEAAGQQIDLIGNDNVGTAGKFNVSREWQRVGKWKAPLSQFLEFAARYQWDAIDSAQQWATGVAVTNGETRYAPTTADPLAAWGLYTVNKDLDAATNTVEPRLASADWVLSAGGDTVAGPFSLNFQDDYVGKQWEFHSIGREISITATNTVNHADGTASNAITVPANQIKRYRVSGTRINPVLIEIPSGTSETSGLRGEPVASLAELTALAARDNELRRVTGATVALDQEYVFRLGLTAIAPNVADDDATGSWVLQVSQSVAPSDILIGTLFYDTNNTPTPGKLFAGETYNWVDNPKLEAKFQAQGHAFIEDNGDGTLTVAQHTDFIRAGSGAIGVHVDDTTAANGLKIQGTAHDNNIGGSIWPKMSDVNDARAVNIQSDDTETAPNHRAAYFGVYGDVAEIVVDAIAATVVQNLAGPTNDTVPSTAALQPELDALRVVAGQFAGNGPDADNLPTVIPQTSEAVSVGDYAIADADIIGTGTASAPEKPRGRYRRTATDTWAFESAVSVSATTLTFEAVADLPDPSTVVVGTVALVINDPEAVNNGQFIASGSNIGSAATYWLG